MASVAGVVETPLEVRIAVGAVVRLRRVAAPEKESGPLTEYSVAISTLAIKSIMMPAVAAAFRESIKIF